MNVEPRIPRPPNRYFVFDIRSVTLQSARYVIAGGVGGIVEGRVQRPEAPLVFSAVVSINGVESKLVGESPSASFAPTGPTRVDPIEFRGVVLRGAGVEIVLNAKR